MTRRRLFALLAALPVVGRWVLKPEPVGLGPIALKREGSAIQFQDLLAPSFEETFWSHVRDEDFPT